MNNSTNAKTCYDFWCIHSECQSYNTGSLCPSCPVFCECFACICNNHDPNITCEDLVYYIMHGFPEVE